MNKLETVVYNLVRKNPALKQIVRNLYQGVFDLLPRKKETFEGPIQFREGFFFGFHDVQPFSYDESKVLANYLHFDLRMPRKWECLSVGYFDFTNGKICNYLEIGKSLAWNYHKGCRLQWLNQNNIIYNSAKDDALVAVIYNVDSKEEVTIPFPIDTVHGDMATTFSYERLERCMPGYGYPYCDGGDVNESAPNNTGLFIVDLKSLERTLLISLYDLAIKVTGNVEHEYLHFVTHTEFSPNGQYISFLYRRIPKEGDYMKRRSVMCIYNMETQEVTVLPSQESGSHYVWNSKNQIIASCIINGNSCHVLFDEANGWNGKVIAKTVLNSDGHQSFINDDEFITDTYPDKYRMAKLYKADIKTNSAELIASIYSPKAFQTKDFKCHIACDLHPRVSPTGRFVCFDSPRTGKRGIYIMQLTTDLHQP